MRLSAIIKSVTEPTGGEAEISGLISTPDLDLDGEKIDPEGLDFSYFLDRGFFNWNHTPELLGYPTGVEVGPEGVEVTGRLLLHIPKAREVYALAKSFLGTPRALGYSVEGQAVKRRGSIIEKAKIFHVAITSTPINPACSMLVKGRQPGQLTRRARREIIEWIKIN